MTTNAQNGNWSEWIEWNGGECPLPAGTRYEVRFRSGRTAEGRQPNTWRWAREGHSGDIIAYRYKIKYPESKINSDLEKCAKYEWKEDFDRVKWNHVLEGPEWFNSKYSTGDGGYKKSEHSAARQQLDLDQAAVTPEEEEAWQDKERGMSIEEARSILSADNVNHPQHYQSDNGIECIDAIRAALGLDGFVAHCRGTAIKYAFRAGKKQAHAEDLRKAAWYLNRAANALDE